MTTKPDTPPRSKGRPLKGDRRNVTIHLELRHIVSLDALSVRRNESRADTLNHVLDVATERGLLGNGSDA